MHMIFISTTFYKKIKYKMVMITLFAQENFCGVFSSMVPYFFLSIYKIRLRYYFAV